MKKILKIILILLIAFLNNKNIKAMQDTKSKNTIKSESSLEEQTIFLLFSKKTKLKVATLMYKILSESLQKQISGELANSIKTDLLKIETELNKLDTLSETEANLKLLNLFELMLYWLYKSLKIINPENPEKLLFKEFILAFCSQEETEILQELLTRVNSPVLGISILD